MRWRFPLLFAITAMSFVACTAGRGRARFDWEEDSSGADAGIPGFDGGAGFGDGAPGARRSLLDASCATATSAAMRVPVYMTIVLDGSGSMMGNKWNAARGALDAVLDDALAKGDDGLAIGLIVFADEKDPSPGASGPYPTVIDVEPRFVDSIQHVALRARVDDTAPFGNTPTYAALSGAYSAIATFDAQNPPAPLKPGGRKVVVLMTDGVPNGFSVEQQQCLQLAKSHAPPGGDVRLFSVGIGPFGAPTSTYDPVFMGQLAVAGGTRASQSCNPSEMVDTDLTCHFQITPGSKTTAQLTQEFIGAINRIRTAAAACEYVLEKGDAGAVDTDHVNVVFVDGQKHETVIPQDPTDGWTYDDPNDPRKVLLNGASCERVKRDPAGDVRVVLGCQTFVP